MGHYIRNGLIGLFMGGVTALGSCSDEKGNEAPNLTDFRIIRNQSYECNDQSIGIKCIQIAYSGTDSKFEGGMGRLDLYLDSNNQVAFHSIFFPERGSIRVSGTPEISVDVGVSLGPHTLYPRLFDKHGWEAPSTSLFTRGFEKL